MCAVGRSSLFVNARVHLPGSKGRAAVSASTIGYIATRPGADASPTPGDLRRAEMAERMALAGYYAERPGSTALFDQDGAVPLSEARARLATADGALSTWVVSVRREEAGELRLGCKEEWQRWCRRELTPALAVAMGVPESSVRWMAAEHENAPNSKHVHVVAWSSDGSFSSIMPRRWLERAREMMTDAALEPAARVALSERDVARRAAIEAARAIPAESVSVELPSTGRISYAHLRRWHPETASDLLDALRRIDELHPRMAEAKSLYREAVDRCAELKGLTGDERTRYVRAAMDDLDARRANALLRTLVPDRAEAGPDASVRSAAPTDGPAIRRAAERRMRGEVAACATRRELDAAASAVRERRPVPEGPLRSCPSYRRALKSAPAAAGRAALAVLAAGASQDRRRDIADEAGEAALRILARAALAALRTAAAAGGEAVRINSRVQREVRL